MQRWPDLLVGLSGDERRVLSVAVTDNVLEGWEPSRADIQALVDVVRGYVTTQEYLANLGTSAAAR